MAAAIDRGLIDRLAHGLAGLTRVVSGIDDWLDRLFVDGLVNRIGRWTYAAGLRLRAVQTGQLRQYVMALAIGIVVVFLLMSLHP